MGDSELGGCFRFFCLLFVGIVDVLEIVFLEEDVFDVLKLNMFDNCFCYLGVC